MRSTGLPRSVTTSETPARTRATALDGFWLSSRSPMVSIPMMYLLNVGTSSHALIHAGPAPSWNHLQRPVGGASCSAPERWAECDEGAKDKILRAPAQPGADLT